MESIGLKLVRLQQYDNLLESVAAAAGAYYEKLIACKLPEPLVFELVKDWHHEVWENLDSQLKS